jgi:chromosome segregation protein
MHVAGRGFLADLELSFDAHLNALIGGRGTGKSAVLETVRYGLNMAPYCDEQRRQYLVNHALGAGGEVRLQIERCTESGVSKRYEIVRVLGSAPQVFDLDTGVQVDIPPQDAFGPNQAPIILLQREIDLISKDVGYRRDLLDRLIGDDVRRAEEQVVAARRQLSLNSTELRRHRLEQARRPEIAARSKFLEHELQVYEDNGVLDKLADHRHLDSVSRHLGEAEEATTSAEPWSKSLTDTQENLDELILRFTTTDDELTQEACGILKSVVDAIAIARAQLADAAGLARERLTTLRAAHERRTKELMHTLNEVKQLLHAENFDPDATLRFTAELDQCRTALAALDRKKPAIDQLLQERRGILDDLSKARDRESKVRQDAAELINNRLSQRLEVVVEPFGDREQFTEELRNLIGGSGAQGAAINAIASSEGVDGATVAGAVEAGPEVVASRFAVTSAQAAKIHTWLTDPEFDRLAELEALAPRDKVSVRLRVGQDSRDLDQLSAGQRATAILLLIFSVDGRTMLLDQPEDDLDNRFIYEDVVSMIRQQKALTPDGRDRQIITATHNPNIPMLGDAEFVAVLDATNDGMRVSSNGSIDALEIRTHIRQVLEGGEEAFLRRYHKYGGLRSALPIPPWQGKEDERHT